MKVRQISKFQYFRIRTIKWLKAFFKRSAPIPASIANNRRHTYFQCPDRMWRKMNDTDFKT